MVVGGTVVVVGGGGGVVVVVGAGGWVVTVTAAAVVVSSPLSPQAADVRAKTINRAPRERNSIVTSPYACKAPIPRLLDAQR